MKNLMSLGAGVMSIALTGVAHAQMRIPYSNAPTLDTAKKCAAAAEAESLGASCFVVA